MPTLPLQQEHHGISVTDLAAMERALRVLGFSEVQANAPEPLTYRDRPDDPVGELTCGVLSDPYRTRYIENPQTGQQIDLIEISHDGLSTPEGGRPLQGDLRIGIPVALSAGVLLAGPFSDGNGDGPSEPPATAVSTSSPSATPTATQVSASPSPSATSIAPSPSPSAPPASESPG